MTADNPTESDLDDLQLRAKSQYTYSIAGAAAIAVLGVVLMLVFSGSIGFTNTLLVGSATAFGIAILLISAADMKADDRTLDRHRDEQKMIEGLISRYKKAPEGGHEVHAESPTSPIGQGLASKTNAS